MSESAHINFYINRLFDREGGFANVRQDKGGATKYGITRTTLSFFRGHEVGVEDVRALEREEAHAIYRRLYFQNHRIGLLPDEIEEQVFDFGVHSGPFIAIQALQECLGVKVDGVIGPLTAAAAARACAVDGGRALNNQLACWRVMMLGRIARRDPSQMTFLQGWLRRALDFIR